MSAFLRKYNAASHVYVPIIKRGVVDFAVGADWTPAAGDVKVSKDGGAAANIGTLPSAIAMGNAAYWDFTLTATELSAAKVIVTIADSSTKAVEDQAFIVETYGNASAQHAVDLSDAVRAGLTALPNAAAEAAGGLYTRGSGAGQINQPANGMVDTNVVRNAGTAITSAAGVQEVKVASIAANAITATAINADAITAAKIADGAIDAATFATGAITAAAIAADAIGASELAADAVTEIQSGLSTYAGGDTAGVTTLLSRLSATRAGYLDNLSAGAVATASALTSAAGDITTLLGKLTGITSLAQWLGLIAGKQTGNSTARTELRATGAGSGTFDETTDSQEALRDRGDAAWITATGFSTLDAAGVRSAVGLASANLDTQLSGISEDVATVDGVVDAVKAKTDNLPSDPADQSALEAAIAGIDVTADVAAIMAVTEALPDAGALTSLAQASALAAVDDKIGTVTDLGNGATIGHNLADLWQQADGVSGALAAVQVATDKLDDTLEDNAGTYRFTAAALAEAPSGGGSAPTAEAIADAVWDEDLTTHTTPDSAGDTLGNVATGTPPTAAAIRAEIDANSTQLAKLGTPAGASMSADIAAVKAQTGAIETDTQDIQSRLPAALTGAGNLKTDAQVVSDKTGYALTVAYDAAKTAASQASVDDLPTNAELSTALSGADDAVLAAIAALNNLSVAGVRSAVGLASANLDTQLAMLAGYVDTEIGTLLTNLAAVKDVVDAVKLKTDGLPSDPADESALEAAITAAESTITAAIAALENLSASAAATGLLDLAAGVETGLTVRQALRLIVSTAAGKLSGADGSEIRIRDLADAKDRIVATVDEHGNRAAVTVDVS